MWGDWFLVLKSITFFDCRCADDDNIVTCICMFLSSYIRLQMGPSSKETNFWSWQSSFVKFSILTWWISIWLFMSSCWCFIKLLPEWADLWLIIFSMDLRGDGTLRWRWVAVVGLRLGEEPTFRCLVCDDCLEFLLSWRFLVEGRYIVAFSIVVSGGDTCFFNLWTRPLPSFDLTFDDLPSTLVVFKSLNEVTTGRASSLASLIFFYFFLKPGDIFGLLEVSGLSSILMSFSPSPSPCMDYPFAPSSCSSPLREDTLS